MSKPAHRPGAALYPAERRGNPLYQLRVGDRRAWLPPLAVDSSASNPLRRGCLMSYNVAIAQEVPDDDVVAWQWFEEVADDEVDSPAPVFHQLIDQLTARFPCICDLADKHEGVWSDGPLRYNIECRVPVLGMTHSKADEVLPFLIETANGLGLTVLDFQTDRIHRPTGTGSTTPSGSRQSGDRPSTSGKRWWEFWK